MSNEVNDNQEVTDPKVTTLKEDELQNAQGGLLVPAVQKTKLATDHTRALFADELKNA